MPLPQQPAPSLTAEEQVVWTDAVDFYDRTIASHDLLFDPFDRAWPAYRDPIEQQVRPFVDGRITYEGDGGESCESAERSRAGSSGRQPGLRSFRTLIAAMPRH